MLVQVTVSRREEEEEIEAWLPNLLWVTLGAMCHSRSQPYTGQKRQLLAEIKYEV